MTENNLYKVIDDSISLSLAKEMYSRMYALLFLTTCWCCWYTNNTRSHSSHNTERVRLVDCKKPIQSEPSVIILNLHNEPSYTEVAEG